MVDSLYKQLLNADNIINTFLIVIAACDPESSFSQASKTKMNCEKQVTEPTGAKETFLFIRAV
jgi:hypothetical protein